TRHLILAYAPRDRIIAQGPSVSQLPGALLLVGILGLAVALYRRREAGVLAASSPASSGSESDAFDRVPGRAFAHVPPASVASFGIAWLCITLLPVSNFIV